MYFGFAEIRSSISTLSSLTNWRAFLEIKSYVSTESSASLRKVDIRVNLSPTIAESLIL